MTTTRPELTGVAGVMETALSASLLARLPAESAPAPWTCECEGIVWLDRGGSRATAALPPALRPPARALAVVGAFVRYLDTPVGPYDEVLGLVVSRTGLRVWGSVAFMAVDSPASLVGGRANWAMPKTLAWFTGAPGDRTMTARSEGDPAWSVAAYANTFGRAIPLKLANAPARQGFAGGRIGESLLRGNGEARLARVRVDVESVGPLASWLRPGSRLGAVVERATFHLDAPTIS